MHVQCQTEESMSAKLVYLPNLQPITGNGEGKIVSGMNTPKETKTKPQSLCENLLMQAYYQYQYGDFGATLRAYFLSNLKYLTAC